MSKPSPLSWTRRLLSWLAAAVRPDTATSLRELDDHTLFDIGLTRADLVAAERDLHSRRHSASRTADPASQSLRRRVALY